MNFICSTSIGIFSDTVRLLIMGIWISDKIQIEKCAVIVKILNLLYHAFMYSLLILLSRIYPFTQWHSLLVTIICYWDIGQSRWFASRKTGEVGDIHEPNIQHSIFNVELSWQVMLFQNSPRLKVGINYTRIGLPSRYKLRPWLAKVCPDPTYISIMLQ